MSWCGVHILTVGLGLPSVISLTLFLQIVRTSLSSSRKLVKCRSSIASTLPKLTPPHWPLPPVESPEQERRRTRRRSSSTLPTSPPLLSTPNMYVTVKNCYYVQYYTVGIAVPVRYVQQYSSHACCMYICVHVLVFSLNHQATRLASPSWVGCVSYCACGGVHSWLCVHVK